MDDLRLEDLSATNCERANNLELRPGQEQFANPTTYVNAEGQIDPSKAWSKVILRDGDVVGVVRAYFDSSYPDEELRSCVWNISVAASAQRAGVGRFALIAATDEARARGLDTLSVMWEDSAEGPGDFFTRMGFVDSRASAFGDRIGVMTLS